MSSYDDLLPKNHEGFRTHLTCELCGYEPRTKNRYREKQDHQMRIHFMKKVNETFPSLTNFNCPSPDCVFIAKDKQAFLRHYISKHGLIEKFLKETLAERGIDWQPPGFGTDKTSTSKKYSVQKTTNSEATTQEYVVTEDFESECVEGGEGISDDTFVLVQLEDDNPTQEVFEGGVDENPIEGHTTIRQIDLDGSLVQEFFIDTAPKEEEKGKKSRKRINAESNPDKRRSKKKRQKNIPDNEDPKAKTIRRILENTSEESSHSDSASGDSGEEASMSLPLSKQRMRKDARNYQLLQMFAVDLERENSTLRSENRALRARVEVLLDALVEKVTTNHLSYSSLQNIGRNHPDANLPLVTEILSEAKARASLQLEETDEQID